MVSDTQEFTDTQSLSMTVWNLFNFRSTIPSPPLVLSALALVVKSNVCR